MLFADMRHDWSRFPKASVVVVSRLMRCAFTSGFQRLKRLLSHDWESRYALLEIMNTVSSCQLIAFCIHVIGMVSLPRRPHMCAL
jgi:hypothetical protein